MSIPTLLDRLSLPGLLFLAMGYLLISDDIMTVGVPCRRLYNTTYSTPVRVEPRRRFIELVSHGHVSVEQYLSYSKD